MERSTHSTVRGTRFRGVELRRRGLSLVETALVLPFFLVFMFGSVDIGRALFAHLTLQHAVREAGRFAVTGRTLPGQNGATPRLDSVIRVAVNDSLPFRLTAADVRVSSRAGGVGSAGGPGDLVTIAVDYPVEFLTPLIGRFFRDGRYMVHVATTFRNEFFPPGQWR